VSTKTSAIPLLVTTSLAFLLRKQYFRAICFFLTSIPFAAGWTIWSAWHHITLSDPVALFDRDYMGFYRLNVTWNELPKLFCLQLPQALGAIGNSILFDGHEIVMTLAAGFATLGAVRLLAEAKLWHVGGFAAAYLMELLFWVYPINERFLFPLTLLFIAGVVRETENACRIIQETMPSFRRLVTRRILLASASAAWLSILILNGRTIFFRIPRTLARYRTALHQRGAAYSWVNRNLPEDSAFVAYDDVNLNLYTGHPAYRNQPLPRSYLTGDRAAMESTITGLAEFAWQHRLQYILCGDDDYEINDMLRDRALREKLFEKNRGLQQIYASPGVRIYRVD
jgi:hypothetical protein